MTRGRAKVKVFADCKKRNVIAKRAGKLNFRALRRSTVKSIMRINIQFILALAGACLTTGCVVPGAYRDYVEVAPQQRLVDPPVEYVVPRVVIVENGVRHDRYYYQRHPEYYRRDQLRYPERFGPVHHVDRYPYHHPVPPPYRGNGPGYATPDRPEAHRGDQGSRGTSRQAPEDNHKGKKKKKHHDDDRH